MWFLLIGKKDLNLCGYKNSTGGDHKCSSCHIQIPECLTRGVEGNLCGCYCSFDASSRLRQLCVGISQKHTFTEGEKALLT